MSNPASSTPVSAADVLNREFLEIRARLLQVAAAFDRLDRASGSVAEDPRRQNLQRALELLAAERPDRAEQLQLIFSRSYNPQWRSEFKLTNGHHS